jgi:putative mRNA 3-end processing factor
MVDKGTQNVCCVHGDHTQDFADWVKNEFGVNAFAPKMGDEINI